jgi:F0F1-type ATP synthase assembly protein I
MALTVGLGIWAGLWADRRLGWKPWGLVGGVFAGAGVGLTVFILDALRLSRMADEEEKKRK